jgi:cysteine desulfurase
MRQIYLDHNATSPASPEHLQALTEILARSPGNPSSLHTRGREANVLISEARKSLAASLGSFEPGECIFVSGGSEANNLGTAGVLKCSDRPLSEQHVIISAIEHPSISEPLRSLAESHGLQITVVPAGQTGFVSCTDVISAIRPSTTLISIMAANNETGAVQPVQQIGEWLHGKRWKKLESELDAFLSPEISMEHLKQIHFHVDAVQAFGKLKTVNWMSSGIDSLSVSAHKLGGLSGIGALALRKGRRFAPAILGGSQERRRRAGTENLIGILSFGLISNSISQSHWWEHIQNIHTYKMLFFSALQEWEAQGSIKLNSASENSLPNTVNFSIQNASLSGEDILMELDMAGICASSGSACSSGVNLPSKTLLGMGRSTELAKNAIRLSLGPHLKAEDVEYTLEVLQRLLNPGK